MYPGILKTEIFVSVLAFCPRLSSAFGHQKKKVFRKQSSKGRFSFKTPAHSLGVLERKWRFSNAMLS